MENHPHIVSIKCFRCIVAIPQSWRVNSGLFAEIERVENYIM